MSGFVGMFRRDGGPVDGAELDTMTQSLRLRGPEGIQTWRRGPVGLGHARFVTHPARDGETQPIMLDDRLVLTGHIRLDGREELIGSLEGAGIAIPRDVQDATLALYAYRAWRGQCLERLHGDFSFGIWDCVEQTLFCARDPFGVRPLFYAAYPDLFLFGNTLGSLRAHPHANGELDELALADFLMCGYPLDPALTFFRDIRRLPAAHCMTVAPAGMRIERYWALPEEPELRYRRTDDYVEHFADLLARAVRDRTGRGPVGLSLSGGLDSGAIAAAMVGKLGHRSDGAPAALAYSWGWNCAFIDPEPRAAARSAAALGIPLEILEATDCVPLRSNSAWVAPEPSGDYFFAQSCASLATMAAGVRVNLCGQGGDEVLGSEMLLDEVGRAPAARLAFDALHTWAVIRRPPLGLRARLGLSRSTHVLQRVPSYLAPAWQRDLGLTERLSAMGPFAKPAPAGRRPRARSRLQARLWGPYLEGLDPGFTGVALETRWPFLDERVVRFGLSLPPLPWCVDKHLLRRSLRDILPQAITRRPKSPLAGDPLESFLAQEPNWSASMRAGADLGGRVDLEAWQRTWDAPLQQGDLWQRWQRAWPLALARWLQRGTARPKPFPARTPGEVKSLMTRSPQVAQVSHEID